MLNYFVYLCQLMGRGGAALLLVFALISGCATRLEERIDPIDAIPQWMKLPERVSFRGVDGEYLAHPFFDLAPFPHTEDMSVNFFPVTAQGSPFGYELDLHSGMLYRSFRYCSQADVWKKYGKLQFPPYTTGIVPRLLDQLGQAQEIKVFGRSEFYHQRNPMEVRSFRVRVVGGQVVQYCPKYPCSGKGSWRGKIVMFGVDASDKSFENIMNLDELKKKVNWGEVLAMIQNERGRFEQTKNEHPAFRTVGEVEAKRALAYAFKRGHHFKFEELKTLRDNCVLLYDHLWDTSQNLRKHMDEKLNGPTEFEKYKESLEQSRFIKEEFEAKTTVSKMQESFAYWFRIFQEKYSERFYTCSRFVRGGNITNDADRHWFFAHLSLFVRMQKLGMIYLCRKRAWVENPKTLENKFLYDPQIELKICRDGDLDRAFDAAERTLIGLAQSREEHYRYLEYDMSEGGSHQKLYSWIFNTGKQLGCSDKKQIEQINATNLYPEFVKWLPFAIDDKQDLIR